MKGIIEGVGVAVGTWVVATIEGIFLVSWKIAAKSVTRIITSSPIKQIPIFLHSSILTENYTHSILTEVNATKAVKKVSDNFIIHCSVL